MIPLTMAALLDPSPRQNGMRFLHLYLSNGIAFPICSYATSTPLQTRLVESFGITEAPSPVYGEKKRGCIIKIRIIFLIFWAALPIILRTFWRVDACIGEKSRGLIVDVGYFRNRYLGELVHYDAYYIRKGFIFFFFITTIIKRRYIMTV